MALTILEGRGEMSMEIRSMNKQHMRRLAFDRTLPVEFKVQSVTVESCGEWKTSYRSLIVMMD